MKTTILTVVLTALTTPALVSAQIPDINTLQGITNLPVNNLISILTNAMQWLLALVAVLAVIAFVISGILYLTAGGDEDAIARAKRAFIGAIFGVIVSLLGLIILQAAQTVLSGTTSQF